MRFVWAEVRSGSKTEVSGLVRHVRFTLRSRHRQPAPASPFGARNGSGGYTQHGKVVDSQGFMFDVEDDDRQSSNVPDVSTNLEIGESLEPPPREGVQ